MTTYKNPILTGTYPDPSVCRVGDDYYLVNSSFCYFPGVPIFHSRDLIHWQQIGHCLTRRSQLNLDNAPFWAGIFAPTLRYHDGRFYMITTNTTGGGNFFVWTDDPYGEWSDPIWLDQEGIDPSLTFDDDGRVYFTSTGIPSGIIQSEIDIKTGKILRKAEFIWHGMGGRYPEGPHLYHIGDYYYLMISEGGTEYAHRLTLARSTSPWGPFEPCPHNPIFTHMNIPQNPLQATGHADLLQDHAGNWWIVCLAIRPSSGFPAHHLGRETILVPAGWDEDGWLVINDGKPAQLEMDVETTLPIRKSTCEILHDDFDDDTLAMCWNFIRTSQKDFWSLKARPSWLRLTGTGDTLDEVGAPAFVGRRQQYFESEIRVLMDYVPKQAGDEAGLTLYQNDEHHYELYVMYEDNQRYVAVRQRIGSLIVVTTKAAIPDGEVTLIIRTTNLDYTFAYMQQNTTHTLGSARTRYLSSEVAGGFTGVYMGMYTYGDTPADFDWFEINL